MTTETVVNDSGEVVKLEFKDELQELAYRQLVTFINERNGNVATANAAHGDRASLIESLTETSDDAAIVAAREARDEAMMRLHELVTPKVQHILDNAESSVAEVEEKIKELDKKIKPGLTFYKLNYGEDAVKGLPAQVRIKGGSGGTSSGGGRRIRNFEIVTTIDGEELLHENMASLAKYLDVETSTLQDKFFGDAKSLKDVPDVVEFDVPFTEVDEDDNKSENTAHVTATRQVKDDDDTTTEAAAEAPEVSNADVTPEDV